MFFGFGLFVQRLEIRGEGEGERESEGEDEG